MVISEDRTILNKENNCLNLAVLMSVGQRDNQEDCFGFDLTDNDGLICICDGMGGHRGGELASRHAVQRMIDSMSDISDSYDKQDCFTELVRDIDSEISSFRDENDDPLRAGSTIVSVFISGKELYWVSVGDSRLYISRNRECIQVTKDHIYELALSENRDAGLISEEFYQNESDKSEALISFLGAGELPLIDSNTEPFNLQSGDILFLMSDGVYRYIDKKLLVELVSKAGSFEQALLDIESEIVANGTIKNIQRDNLTLAIVNIK